MVSIRQEPNCADHEGNPSGRPKKKCLTLDSMNPQVRALQYAIRGPIYTRSVEISCELEENARHRYNFRSLIRATAGDAPAMGQPTLTFIRQVFACIAMPELRQHMPEDVNERATMLLGEFAGGTVASYNSTFGGPIVRRHVADFIEERDAGVPSNPEDIIFSPGASVCIEVGIQQLVY